MKKAAIIPSEELNFHLIYLSPNLEIFLCSDGSSLCILDHAQVEPVTFPTENIILFCSQRDIFYYIWKQLETIPILSSTKYEKRKYSPYFTWRLAIALQLCSVNVKLLPFYDVK